MISRPHATSPCGWMLGAMLALSTMLLSMSGVALATDMPGMPAAKVKNPAAELPDPAALPTDWFGYFADAGGELEARVASQRKQLMAMEVMLERDAAARPLIPQVLLQLDRYLALRMDVESKGIEPFVAPERLNLNEALRLGRELDTLDSEIGLARRALERDERQDKVARRTLDDEKIGYMALDKADPGRLAGGLRIMRARFEVESEQLERERAGKLLTTNEKRAELIQAFLAGQAEFRLQASPVVTEAWNKELTSLRVERDTARRGIAPVPSGAADARMQLDLLRQDAGRALLDARIALAEHMLAFNGWLEKPEGVDPDALRTELAAQAERFEGWEESLSQWRDDLVHQRDLARKQDEGDVRGVADAETRLRALDGIQVLLDRLDARLRDIALVSRLQDDWLIARQGLLERWTAEGFQQLRGIGATLGAGMSASLFEINETPVTTLGLLRVLLILTVIWWVSKGIRKALVRVTANRPGVNPASVYALGKVIHYVLITIGVMISLSTLGLDISKFALLASALGVGIGFGLQNLVSNFVSGLILLFERSLKVGDFIELESGVSGSVRQINIRSTLVTTNDNVDIVIPNAEFVNGRVINWTMNEAARRVHIPFGVAYGTDKEKVRQAVVEAANNVRFTLQQPGREPQVWLVKFGDSSLDFELVVWLTLEGVQKPGLVNATYTWEIESALTAHGIEIPFPQRDVHVRSFFGQAGDDAARVWHGRKAEE